MYLAKINIELEKKRSIKKINYYKKQNTTGWGHNSFHFICLFKFFLFIKKDLRQQRPTILPGVYLSILYALCIVYILYRIEQD